MGLRFRKSISLGKGARINLSSSGIGFSLGCPGMSISAGRRGLYANVGIPGTGISGRFKIGGSSRKRRSKSRSGSRSNSHSNAYTSAYAASDYDSDLDPDLDSELDSGSSSTSSSDPWARLSPERRRALKIIMSHASIEGDLPLKVGMDDAGEPLFRFEGSDEDITDPDVIRELKRRPEVKATIAELRTEQMAKWEELRESSERASREFVEIWRLAPKVVEKRTFARRLANLRLKTYERKTFDRPRPTRAEIRGALEEEARQHASGLFKKRKAERYVTEHWARFAEDYAARWIDESLAFEAEQDAIEAETNRRYLEEYERRKAVLERTLSTDEDVVLQLAEEWLAGITIPADIDAQFDFANGWLYLDLDLPEVEDLPATTTRQLKSGRVKVVDKSQKRLRQEYATCVLGLAFFLAACLFNVSAAIDGILVSGYTQRRNRDGDIEDDYIYSVRFPREQFRKTAVEDPVSAFNEFENRMKLGTTFTFSEIKPYEME